MRHFRFNDPSRFRFLHNVPASPMVVALDTHARQTPVSRSLTCKSDASRPCSNISFICRSCCSFIDTPRNKTGCVGHAPTSWLACPLIHASKHPLIKMAIHGRLPPCTPSPADLLCYSGPTKHHKQGSPSITSNRTLASDGLDFSAEHAPACAANLLADPSFPQVSRSKKTCRGRCPLPLNRHCRY